MSKKKSLKKSDSLALTNESETADLSPLIEAAKSSFMEFQEEHSTNGAERAGVFEDAELEDLKAAVDLLGAERQEQQGDTQNLQSIQDSQDIQEAEVLRESVEPSVLDSLVDSMTERILETIPFQQKDLDFIEEISDEEMALGSSDSSDENVSLNSSMMLDSKLSGDMSSSIDEVNDLDELFESADVSEDSVASEATEDSQEEPSEFLIAGSELEDFDSVAIEELEFIEEAQLESIVESVLFATDRPVSIPTLKQIFKGTNVTNARLKKALEVLRVEYAGGRRGVTLEEVGSGYQLRTKVDNMEFLRRSFKAKSFKLSGPALEVLAITAYKQPVVKAEIDEIRGVESGHLLRALMEKNLVLFAGKSDLPGKPMQYATTRKFLEIFGLRNLKELPTLSQIDELLPEGIGDEEEKPKLADLTDGLSEKVGLSYSEGEEELLKISDQLEKIDTSSEFFEKEKQRQKQQREAEKARNIQEAIAVGEDVSNRDRNWLKRYEEQIQSEAAAAAAVEVAVTGSEGELTAAVMEEISDSSLEKICSPQGFISDKNRTNDPLGDVQGLDKNPRFEVMEGRDESEELELTLKAWDLSSETKDDEESDALAERMESNDLANIEEDL